MSDEKKLPPAIEAIRARGRERGDVEKARDMPLDPHEREANLVRSMLQQADALEANAPQGELAREDYERNVAQLMDEEPFWPIANRPANPYLAMLTGFDVEDDELEGQGEP